MTPLHVAAERAHNDILEVLQKHGAKVHTTHTHTHARTDGRTSVIVVHHITSFHISGHLARLYRNGALEHIGSAITHTSPLITHTHRRPALCVRGAVVLMSAVTVFH